jgi:hypothetical protein
MYCSCYSNTRGVTKKPKPSINLAASNHANAERLSARGDGWPADAGPAIAGNMVADYGFASNPVASYGVVGIPVAGDMLPATGSPFTLGILVTTPICCMFLQINVHVLYILVKLPIKCCCRKRGRNVVGLLFLSNEFFGYWFQCSMMLKVVEATATARAGWHESRLAWHVGMATGLSCPSSSSSISSLHAPHVGMRAASHGCRESNGASSGWV